MRAKPTLTGTGYLYRDAEARTSQSGKTYTVAPLVLSVEQDRDDGTRGDGWFVRALVFGRDGEAAAALRKGATCAFCGQLERSYWTPKDGGDEREQWTLMADAFSGANGAHDGQRPQQRRQGGGQQRRQQPQQAQQQQGGEPDWPDAEPF